MAASAVTNNSKNIKQTISHEIPNEFCQNMCHTDAFIACEGTKQVRHIIPRNSCYKKKLGSDYVFFFTLGKD